jgi:hypothetical protein
MTQVRIYLKDGDLVGDKAAKDYQKWELMARTWR